MSNVINLFAKQEANEMARKETRRLRVKLTELGWDIEALHMQAEVYRTLSRTMENQGDRFIAMSMANETVQKAVKLQSQYDELKRAIA